MGPLYRAFEGLGSAVAKGEVLMTGTWHLGTAALANIAEAVHAPAAGALRSLEQTNEEMGSGGSCPRKGDDADPATTGMATQIVHSLGESAYLMGTGGLMGGPVAGAALLGGAEGVNRYQELREKGVDPETAGGSAGTPAFTSAAGALVPAGFGSSLLTRVLTGAGSNIAIDKLGRYQDHRLLDISGYPEMAAQQKPLDAAEMFADGILGAAFGGLAHLQVHAAPGAEDAARTVSVALEDRKLAPGIPTDPAAANAHQAALEKATSDLLQGKRVDVSGTGVDQADFLSRPKGSQTDAESIFADALREGGIFEQQQNLRALEAELNDASKPSPPCPRNLVKGSGTTDR